MSRAMAEANNTHRWRESAEIGHDELHEIGCRVVKQGVG